MIRKVRNYLLQLRSLQRINMAMSRGAATSTLRTIDPTDPDTWEFSGFSQNGEDGIIDVLAARLRSHNRYFIEIGASDGLENNTSWLALARRWSGIWVEGDPQVSEWSTWLFSSLNYGLETVPLFVDRDNIGALAKRALHLDPDVFSLDIDGTDYYLVEAVFEFGFRPKIFVVEYNSAFGPDRAVTVPYDPAFRRGQRPNDDLYYGCSLSAWRTLFTHYGYSFVTVDLNGVNAFFVRTEEFAEGFIESVRGTPFRENFAQLRQHRQGWERQMSQIEGRPLIEVGGK